MKKLLCVLLALLTVLNVTGCSKKEEVVDENTTELVFWVHTEETWLKSYEKIIADFEAANPGIKVKMEDFPYDEFESKVLTGLSSKSGGADIYEMWGGWGVDYANTGALAALNDEMAADIMEKAYPNTYGSLVYEGKLYGLPLEFNIESGGMLVNLNMLKEAGLEVATTWDELMAQAKVLAKQGNGATMEAKGFDFIGWDGIPYLLTSMILSQGAEYLTEDGKFDFTTPEAKLAFETITNMVTVDHITDLESLSEGATENYANLYLGISAYVPIGPWTINEGMMSEEDGGYGYEYGVDYVYAACPFFTENGAFAAETGWALAINAASEKSEAAQKFLEYFFQDDVIMEHNLACGQIPAKKEVAQSADYLKSYPYVEPLIKILDKVHYIGYFNTERFKENICAVFTDYCTGGIYANIDEALVDLTTRLNEIGE